MTEKERFSKALRREPITGLVPTFEAAFFLTMETLGKVHPLHRKYDQWWQMSDREREAQRVDIADTFIAIAKRYHHSCIFFQELLPDISETVRTLEILRERSNNEFFVVMHGDPTFAIPDGANMMEEIARFYEEPDEIHKLAEQRMSHELHRAEQLVKTSGLIDGFMLCSDYCFNTSPFLSPDMFSEFVAPYLKRICDEYRSMGLYTIKHTDGNIMPIIDQMVQAGPDALHSLDPQGGVDLAVVKRLYGDKVALCGNVNCGLLQTGSVEEAAADVRRALRQGMEGWGYIFSTSNCVYAGMDLDRYEMMNDIWRQEGIYQ